jgi:hypothetical protein
VAPAIETAVVELALEQPTWCQVRVANELAKRGLRKRIYASLEALQADLDAWLRAYNEARPHQGRWCYGKTPMQTFLDSVPLAKEKLLVA